MTRQTNNGSISTALAFVILFVAVFAAGIFIWSAQKEANVPSVPPKNPDKGDAGTNGWKTYQSADKKIEFEYPAEKLSFSQEKGKVVLSHSAPFKHADPCDMRDGQPAADAALLAGAKDLAEITDFEMKVQHVKNNLAGAVKANEPAFFVEDYLDRGTLKISPQYIDAAKFGPVSGYKITNSAEGCGEYVYYLILDPENTLRVSRSIVAEFQPINTDYRENMKIPGVIKPEEEEKLFGQILSTVRFNDGNQEETIVPD